MKALAESGLMMAGAYLSGLIMDVLAQVAIPNAPAFDWGSVSSTAILGWYAWHTQTRTLPKKDSDGREDQAEWRKCFNALADEVRAAVTLLERKDA